MREKNQDLKVWMMRVQQSEDARQVFNVLDQFRKETCWTDDERAQMAKCYMRVLEHVGPPPAEDNAGEGEKNDGPVWYEKM